MSIATKGSMATELVSIGYVAQILGVSRDTVKKWAADGVIPKPLVLGKTRRWRLRDIEALVSADQG
jgi:excisionase family DNA binding protein